MQPSNASSRDTSAASLSQAKRLTELSESMQVQESVVIVIVIVIFRQGVHSANTDFQWSPDNNNIQNIIYLFIIIIAEL